MRRDSRSPLAALALALVALSSRQAFAQAAAEDTIARIRASVVAVGTFERTRSPAFQFLGTGFSVGDGTLVATNAHVLPASVDANRREEIAILLPSPVRDGREPEVRLRVAKPVARDVAHDLALLRIEGAPLVPLAIGDAAAVREGRSVYFTGYPIGAILGAIPVTHRAIVAAITPIAIPQRSGSDLASATIKRLASGAFAVFQLDGTAYPGNSGSPVYEADGGSVIGIVNMVLVKATKESLLAQPSGIAYAIPSAHLAALLASVR